MWQCTGVWVGTYLWRDEMKIAHSWTQSEAAPLPLHPAGKDGKSSRSAHQVMTSEGLPGPRESTTLLPHFSKGYVSSEKTTPIKPTHSIPLVIRPNDQIPLIDFTVQLGHYHSCPVLTIGGPSALFSHLFLQCGWTTKCCLSTHRINYIRITYVLVYS